MENSISQWPRLDCAGRVSSGRTMLGVLLSILFLSTAFHLVLANAAQGAADAEVLFEDDFSVLDASLGTESADLSVRDNALHYKLEAGYVWRTFYESMLFENADINIRVRLPDFSSEQGNAIGVTFWGVNLDEYYLLEVSDSGTFAVFRRNAGRWVTPVPWRSTDAIKTDSGSWNDLRVVTSGSSATIYINGKQVAQIKGKPPEGGSLVGLYFETGKEAGVAEYSALKILSGPAPTESAASADPAVLLADDFTMLDPVWGLERGWFGVKDGNLFIEFNPNESYKALYQAELFEDIDMTVKTKVIAVDGDNDSGSGVVFWADGVDSYYVLTLYSNGAVSVARYVNKRWLFPVKSRPLPPEAKFDPQGWTDLNVKIQGRKATFSANGVVIGSSMGQPPKNGSMVGLFGQSGAKASTSQFAELSIRKP